MKVFVLVKDVCENSINTSYLKVASAKQDLIHQLIKDEFISAIKEFPSETKYHLTIEDNFISIKGANKGDKSILLSIEEVEIV